MATKKKIHTALAKIVDQLRYFNISVNERHIHRAKPNTQAWCMVALAIRDCIEGAHTVRVDSSCIRFSLGSTANGGVRYTFITPHRVTGLIQLFDTIKDQETREKKIKPFKFQLAAAQGYINAMIKPIKRNVSPRKPGPLRPCVKKTRWNGQPIVEFQPLAAKVVEAA